MLSTTHQEPSKWGEVFSEFEKELESAGSEFYRLVWLAGGSAGERSVILRQFADAQSYSLVNVGAELARLLMDIPPRQRAASVLDCFSSLLLEADCVVLDRLELLFDPSLQLNPFDLVKNASRHRLLLAGWPGAIDAESFVYAPAEHPAHQEYPINGVEDRYITL